MYMPTSKFTGTLTRVLTYKFKIAFSCLHRRYRSTARHDHIIRCPVHLDIPKIPLYNLLMDAMKKCPDKTAFVNAITGKEYSYQSFIETSHQFGSLLAKHGYKQNNVIAILSSNCPEYFMAVVGAIGCGGTVTTMNPNYTVDEILYQVRDSGATILTVDENNVDKAIEVANIVGLKNIFVIGNGSARQDGLIHWKDVLLQNASSFPQELSLDPNETVFVPYSSGTTGKPKGVMLSHTNVVTNIFQMTYLLKQVECASIMGLLPFFHVYGLCIIGLASLYNGKKIVTLPKFQPETFLQAIERYRVERINLVPPLLIFLENDPLVDQYDLSSAKEVATGAAPCAENLFTAIRKRFKGCCVRQGYGLTESSALAMAQPHDDLRPGSVGTLVPNSEAKIIDSETGQALGPNQSGEVCIRGNHVMKGYFRRPEETDNCINSDGWLHTGDLGYYDNDYHFYIVDRLKELIKYKGFQVAPAVLEDLILTHPSVDDVAVIGVPHESAGEVPKAFVVKRGDTSEAEIMKFVEERISADKKLRGGVEFIESIPKAPSGKILRRVLREMATSST